MRVDGYVRVSRVGGREGASFISPEVQRSQIEQWCKLRGATLDQVHVDLDQSGASQERPGLTEALRRVETKAVDGIVVAKLDRFARSLTVALDAVHRIDQAGGTVVSVGEGIDPSTPAGKMLQRLLLVFAEWQLDQVRENWREARRRAVERGVHVASATPTGYRRREDGTLEPHPKFGPAIAEVFRRRAAGASWADLGRFLDSQKVEGPYGQVNWRTRAVSNLIDNRVYLGEARSGEFVNTRAHEPIIDEVTWHLAQQAAGAPTSRGEPALLAGILRCAGCRHLIKPDKMTVHGGERIRMYRCRGQHSTGTCGDRAASLGRVVEPWVETQVRERIRAMKHRVVAEEEGGDTTELQAADKDLAEARFALERFRENPRLIVLLGDTEYEAQLGRHLEDVSAAEARITEARAKLSPAGLPVFELEALLDEMTVEEKRRVFRAMIDAVVLRSGRDLPIEDRALVFWRGELPDGWPRRGKRVPLASFAWPDDAEAAAGVAVAKDLEEDPL